MFYKSWLSHFKWAMHANNIFSLLYLITWNELITTFRRIIQALKMTMMIILVMKMNLMLNCLTESNSMKHFLTVYLFKNEKYILLYLPQSCSEVGSKTKYLVLIALFRKLLVHILKKVNKWKNYDQSQKKFQNYFKNCAKNYS